LSLQQIKETILPRFKEAGVKTICFAGGEPLLRFKDIIAIADDVKKAGIEEVMISTNSILVTNEIVKKFKESYKGVDLFMAIPIDSLDQKTMSVLRPPFNDTVEKSRNAVKLALKNGIVVTVETVVTRKNFDDYPSILKTVKKFGAYCFAETYPLFKEGRGKQSCTDLALSDAQLQELDEIKMKNYGKCLTWDFMPFPVGKAEWNTIKNDAREAAQITEGCIAGREYIQVGSDGNVYPCSFLRIKIGNILEKSLKTIWENDPILERFRKRDVTGKCGNCQHKEVCGGCRARAFSETGDYFGGVPSCDSSVDGHLHSKEFTKRVVKTYKKQKLLLSLYHFYKKFKNEGKVK
jgi:radical SAM protein with 4Fe4S-binding SPASM domain